MAKEIFHQGDLASGIQRAISEQKVVACLVRQDEDDESRLWEEEWLSEASDGRSIKDVLKRKAVLLRITFGSREADFLAAFCPITKAPTLVIIQNGQVLERIESGTEREHFTALVLSAVGYEDKISGATGQSDEVSGVLGNIASEPSATPTTIPPSQPAAPQTGISSTGSTHERLPQPSQPSSNAQAILAERARRLEADKARKEAAEKAERIARADARRREAEEASAAHEDKGKQRAAPEEGEKQKVRDAWIYQQKQRKDEAKKERQRILAQIEHDKQERRARVQMTRQQEMQTGAGAFSEISQRPAAASVSHNATSCSLQVRLFDGSSIRAKFAPEVDIATAVRTWVKEAAPDGGADIPYNFRQILAPHPSRTIEVSEEHQSLQELGLLPGANLVLVPIAGATEAYTSAGKGALDSALSVAYFASKALSGLAGSVLRYVPIFGTSETEPYLAGTGDSPEPGGAEDDKSDNDTAAGSSKRRVKTLADQRTERSSKDSTTFYNGNSSAFQGKKEDEDEVFK